MHLIYSIHRPKSTENKRPWKQKRTFFRNDHRDDCVLSQWTVVHEVCQQYFVWILTKKEWRDYTWSPSMPLLTPLRSSSRAAPMLKEANYSRYLPHSGEPRSRRGQACETFLHLPPCSRLLSPPFSVFIHPVWAPRLHPLSTATLNITHIFVFTNSSLINFELCNSVLESNVKSRICTTTPIHKTSCSPETQFGTISRFGYQAWI